MKLFIFSCIGFVFLASCGGKETAKTTDTEKTDAVQTPQMVSFSPQQLKNVGIETGSAQLESISGTLTLQGSIDVPPQNTVSLSFPLGGYLKSTDMLPGMRVKKGQVLAVLEDMQFVQLQQDYLTAKAKFTLAQTEFDRQRELNASKASSDKVFQQAKAEMETQQILMNALAQKLQLISINPAHLDAANISKAVRVVSPINGFISKVNVNVGKYTAPTDMLFELVDPTDIHLALNVFEKDLGKISIGQKVIAYSNNEPDKRFEGEIILINRTIDQDRMAQIHCHFKKYDASLVPGMFMNGEISVNNVQALTVPEEAVVRWENKYYVFSDSENGRFEMTEVKPGVLSHGKQQIEGKGIDTATKLVIKNAYTLLMKIKNTEEEG